MMIGGNFEINVSRLEKRYHDKEARYRHYCKIELGSIMPKEAADKLHELREFFPEDYKLSLMHVNCVGEYVEEV